jgi:hypothetical protein
LLRIDGSHQMQFFHSIESAFFDKLPDGCSSRKKASSKSCDPLP